MRYNLSLLYIFGTQLSFLFETRISARRLVSILRNVQGQQEKAEALADKHGLASDMQPPPRSTLLRKCVWRLKLFGSRLQAG